MSTEPPPPEDPSSEGAGDGRGGTLASLAERYVEGRARSIAVDGRPGPVLRRLARAPVASATVIAAALIALFARIFGVPPVSPLFLVLALCSPLPFWFRLEARAQERWRRGAGETDAHAPGTDEPTLG